jgi:hypothetical protein
MFNQLFIPPLFASATALLPTSVNRLCISVIDEVSPTATTIQNSWNSFRSQFPQRQLYLLQPQGTIYTFANLKLPTNFNIANNGFGPFKVNRDEGTVSNASDWYTICNLEALPDGSKFALFVDNSGSMTNSTVRASLNLLNQKIAARNITYIVRTTTSENWIEPFLTIDLN